MHHVLISGVRDRIEIATCRALLQSAAGLTAADATRLLERLLRGEPQRVTARSASDARLLAAALARLGAAARVETDASE